MFKRPLFKFMIKKILTERVRKQENRTSIKRGLMNDVVFMLIIPPNLKYRAHLHPHGHLTSDWFLPNNAAD